MRVVLHEFITGGGMWSLGSAAPANSLLQEGAAMLAALAADFLALPDVEVWSLRDARLAALHLPGCHVREINGPGQELTLLAELASTADWTVLIAPEFENLLLRRCQVVERANGRLLSPDSEFVRIASDKHLAAQTLAAAGVPVPPGVLIQPEQPLPADFPGGYPGVLKPRDGAGSLGVQLIAGPNVGVDWSEFPGEARLETYLPGTAASVAVLCGSAQRIVLPACSQQLSQDGRFRYQGGSTPLPEPLNQRARRLAEAAIRALPACLGYVGFDLVLGAASDGSHDAVIEVNPRLTTSYIGLRKLCHQNLAAALVLLADNGTYPLSYYETPVVFTARGEILD